MQIERFVLIKKMIIGYSIIFYWITNLLLLIVNSFYISIKWIELLRTSNCSFFDVSIHLAGNNRLHFEKKLKETLSLFYIYVFLKTFTIHPVFYHHRSEYICLLVCSSKSNHFSRQTFLISIMVICTCLIINH